MCEYFSCIIDRKLKVHWLENSNQHETIVEKVNLKDDKLEEVEANENTKTESRRGIRST